MIVHLGMFFYRALCYQVTSIKNAKSLVLSFCLFSAFSKPSKIERVTQLVIILSAGSGYEIKTSSQGFPVSQSLLGKDNDKIGNKEEYWKCVLWTVILNLDERLNFMHSIIFDVRWYKLWLKVWISAIKSKWVFFLLCLFYPGVLFSIYNCFNINVDRKQTTGR